MKPPQTAEEFLAFAKCIAPQSLAAYQASNGPGAAVVLVVDCTDPTGKDVLVLLAGQEFVDQVERVSVHPVAAVCTRPEIAADIARRVGVPEQTANEVLTLPSDRFFVVTLSHGRCLAVTLPRPPAARVAGEWN